jgi:hypothetical protein
MSRPAQPKSPAAPISMETSEAMSETIRAFARPLLYLDPAGPADIETLRTSMMLAMICWNLPVYENTNARLYAHTKKALDAALDLVPAAVRACLHRLVDDRTTKFGEVPCAILVEEQHAEGQEQRAEGQERKLTGRTHITRTSVVTLMANSSTAPSVNAMVRCGCMARK